MGIRVVWQRQLADDVALPLGGYFSIIREGCERFLVAEILAPGLKLLRCVAQLFAQPGERLAKTVRVEVWEAGSGKRPSRPCFHPQNEWECPSRPNARGQVQNGTHLLFASRVEAINPPSGIDPRLDDRYTRVVRVPLPPSQHREFARLGDTVPVRVRCVLDG